MQLEFDREVVLLGGFPIIGGITVEIDAEKNDDGTWSIDIEVTDFEPEKPAGRLTWADVGPSCDAWLVANEERVQRKFDKECRNSV